MDDPAASYKSWKNLLEAACSQVLTLPSDLTHAVWKLDAEFNVIDAVRMIQVGSSSHATYLGTVLESAGRKVTIQDRKSLRNVNVGGESPSLGGNGRKGPRKRQRQ